MIQYVCDFESDKVLCCLSREENNTIVQDDEEDDEVVFKKPPVPRARKSKPKLHVTVVN